MSYACITENTLHSWSVHISCLKSTALCFKGCNYTLSQGRSLLSFYDNVLNICYVADQAEQVKRETVIALSRFLFVCVVKTSPLRKSSSEDLYFMSVVTAKIKHSLYLYIYILATVKSYLCKLAYLPTKSNNAESQHSTFAHCAYLLQNNVDPYI